MSPGPLPLYHQLERELRDRILAGEFEPGAALPSEERICDQYGVSRITVRRALDALIADGLITKRRGVGTFVAARPNRSVRSIRLSGSLDEFLASAGQLATEVLSMSEIPAPEEALRGLKLREAAPVTRLEVVSRLEGEPIGYSEIFLPVHIGRLVSPKDVGLHQPVIRLIESKLGARVARAEQFIAAEIAAEAAANYLSLAPSTPILRITRIYYDVAGEPVEMIVARNHPERYQFAIDFVARPKAV